MILVIVPMLPALANKVTPNNVRIPKKLSNLFTFNWLYGFVASCVLYYVLNVVFPDKRTLISCVVQGDTEVVEGVIASYESTDGNSGRVEKGFVAKLECCFDALVSYKLMGRKPLYITAGRGVTDPLTGAGFSVTLCPESAAPCHYFLPRSI